MKIPQITFENFLERFPLLELPVTLTDEDVSDFQLANDPLAQFMIDQYIPLDSEGNEGFVEYVPCFRLPDTHGFYAVVVWRGDLLKYHYLLMTYDKEGKVLASATIAGTESDGKSILRSVATIDVDWMIHIVEGEHDGDHTMSLYAPLKSRAYKMELLATGEIVFLLDEMESE